jgi:hypothetical protein
MSEINLSSMTRKNRRQALGLLLGAPFLAPAACSQPRTGKARPMVIIIDSGGVLQPYFKKHHLSKTENDFLVIVNLHPTSSYSFRFEKIQFQEGDCVTVQPLSYKKLTLSSGSQTGIYCFTAGGTCPASCPRPFSTDGGDIVIDP